MTHEEKTVVAYHLDQLETLLDASADGDGLMHLSIVAKILRASHGAAAHAPKRGRRKKAEGSEPTGVGATT